MFMYVTVIERQISNIFLNFCGGSVYTVDLDLDK